MTIYHLVTGKEANEIEKEFKGKGYGDFKSELAERVVEFVKPIQKKFNSISDKEVDAILADGAQRARKLAEKKMERVRKVIGL